MESSTKLYVLFLFLCGFAPIFQVFCQSLGMLGMEDCELRLLQVIYRHGDRNPINPYPTDPWKNETYWPEGYGQLTKIGKMQHYRLGQFIRDRYKTFLSEKYSPYEILVKSSTEDRALMSAEANLAGLYPPTDDRSRWNKNLDWQPIPIHSEPAVYDKTLKMSAPCPQYDKLYEDFLDSDFMKKVNEENAELYKLLSNNSGTVVTNPKQAEYLMDALKIEKLYNYTLPEWTKPLFTGYRPAIHYLVVLSFQMMTYTQEMKKLKAGSLVGEILENMKNKTSGAMDERRKFFMFSAHDTTVAAFLNTLDIYNMEPPPYASMIMIELHFNKTSKEYFVEILFRNNTVDQTQEPFILRPACGIPCKLDDFAEFAKSIIPMDREKECQAQKVTYDMIGIVVGALVLGLTLGLLLCLSMLVMSYLRNKRAGPKPPPYPYLHLQMEDGDGEDA